MSAGGVPLGGILVQLNEAIAKRARTLCDPPLDGTEPASELEAFDAGAVFGVVMAAEAFEVHAGQLLAEFLEGTFAAPDRKAMPDHELETFAEAAGIGPLTDARALVEWLVEHGWRRVAL